MSETTEAGRQAAHILLDDISVFDADDDKTSDLQNLALERLNEVGAVTASFDNDDQLHVDISPLVGGLSVLLMTLIRQIELYSGLSRAEVIAAARERIDEYGAIE